MNIKPEQKSSGSTVLELVIKSEVTIVATTDATLHEVRDGIRQGSHITADSSAAISEPETNFTHMAALFSLFPFLNTYNAINSMINSTVI